MRHPSDPRRPRFTKPGEGAVVRADATIRPRDFQPAPAQVSWRELQVHGEEIRLPRSSSEPRDDDR
jgi:hypothetical protein